MPAIEEINIIHLLDSYFFKKPLVDFKELIKFVSQDNSQSSLFDRIYARPMQSLIFDIIYLFYYLNF